MPRSFSRRSAGPRRARVARSDAELAIRAAAGGPRPSSASRTSACAISRFDGPFGGEARRRAARCAVSEPTPRECGGEAARRRRDSSAAGAIVQCRAPQSDGQTAAPGATGSRASLGRRSPVGAPHPERRHRLRLLEPGRRSVHDVDRLAEVAQLVLGSDVGEGAAADRATVPGAPHSRASSSSSSTSGRAWARRPNLTERTGAVWSAPRAIHRIADQRAEALGVLPRPLKMRSRSGLRRGAARRCC